MFATLLGPLPAPKDEVDLGRQIERAVRAQEQAGLEPITDGRLRDPGFARLVPMLAGEDAAPAASAAAAVVESWRATAAMTDRAVKQSLPGPYSLARRL